MIKNNFVKSFLVLLLVAMLPLQAGQWRTHAANLWKNKWFKRSLVGASVGAGVVIGSAACIAALIYYDEKQRPIREAAFKKEREEERMQKEQEEQLQRIEAISSRLLKRDTNFTQLNRAIPKELEVVKEFWNKPQKWTKKGIQLPYKGVLLYGEPGCGKTEYMRALAGEGIPVFGYSATEITNKYQGESERKLREIYDNVKEWLEYSNSQKDAKYPCAVIFMDEIDAIGGKRENMSEHTSGLAILNQMLTLLDGLDKNSKIITIFATNRKDYLDGALIRAGRMDAKIAIANPTLKEKQAIVKSKMDGIGLTRSASLDNLIDHVETDDNKNILSHMSVAEIITLPRLCMNDLIMTQEDDKEENQACEVGTKLFVDSLYKVRGLVKQK